MSSGEGDLQLIESRNCHHDLPCVVHTRVNPSSKNFGVSVYTCSDKQDNCGFKERANVPLQKCPLHGHYIMFRCFRVEEGSPLIRYFCQAHVADEWCGLLMIEPDQDEDKENISPNRPKYHDQFEEKESIKDNDSSNCSEEEDQSDGVVSNEEVSVYSAQEEEEEEESQGEETGPIEKVDDGSVLTVESDSSTEEVSEQNKSIESDKSNKSNGSDESGSDAVEVLKDEPKEKFQVAFQFRTLMKQLADVQILIARHGPYLPDKGAKLKADEHLIKQRMLKLRGYIPSQQELIEHLNKPPSSASSQSNTEEEQSVKQRIHSKAFHGFSKQLTHGAVQNLHSSLDSCPGEDVLEDDPKGLTVSLMKHQKRGLAWLLWREQQIPKGGILADDMGLGKTLSMISLIIKTMSDPLPDTSKQGLPQIKSTLVVVPLTLLGMWEREIQSMVDRNTLSVLVYHGPKRTTDHRDFQYYDIVLTTYSIITNNAAKLIATETNKPLKKGAGNNSDILFRVKWKRVILDEAHNIRNHKAGCSIGCSGLEAEYRWAMTGTPIQNKLEDFYSLIKFIRLSPFNDLRVWKDCISNRSNIGMQRLKAMVSTLVLRRTKEDMTKLKVLKLPDKSVIQHDIVLEDIEKKVYDVIFCEGREFFKRFLTEQGEYLEEEVESAADRVASLMNELPPSVAKAVDKILQFLVHGDEAMEKSSKGRMVLVLLLRLRQACSHLNLLLPAIEKDNEDSDAVTDDLDLNLAMGAISLNEPTSRSHRHMIGDIPYEFNKQGKSAKIKSIVCELEGIIAEPVSDSSLPNKCIIVSQWTSMFNILEHHLDRKDITYTRIDGKVPPKIRQTSVDAFNSTYSNPRVMLLSLKAGGVGLTLTGANHVFIVDLHWNPQLEEQAADRCHRVGQTRPVFIHRFIVKDTIEVGIQALQHKKLELAHQVLSGRKAKLGLTLADLKELFEIH